MERIGILRVFNDVGRSAAHYVNVIRYSISPSLTLTTERAFCRFLAVPYA